MAIPDRTRPPRVVRQRLKKKLARGKKRVPPKNTSVAVNAHGATTAAEVPSKEPDVAGSDPSREDAYREAGLFSDPKEYSQDIALVARKGLSPSLPKERATELTNVVKSIAEHSADPKLRIKAAEAFARLIDRELKRFELELKQLDAEERRVIEREKIRLRRYGENPRNLLQFIQNNLNQQAETTKEEEIIQSENHPLIAAQDSDAAIEAILKDMLG